MATSCPVLRQPFLDRWPRIHRWIKENHVENAKNAVRYNLDVADQQLEMRSPQSIVWQPYSGSDILQHPFIQASFAVSICRYLLLDPQNGATWYLGERCYRQLQGTICIPDDPPVQMSRISRDAYVFNADTQWPISGNFFKEVNQNQYSEYWTAVSGGPTLPPLSRGVNIDKVGYAALVGIDNSLPCTPHQLQGRVYDTQAAATSSGSTSIEWTYEIDTPSGDRLTIPIERPSNNAYAPPESAVSRTNWRNMYIEAMDYATEMRRLLLRHTTFLSQQVKDKDSEILAKDLEIAVKDAEIAELRRAGYSQYPASSSQQWTRLDSD